MRVVTVAGDPEREAVLATELDRRADLDVVLRCVDRVEALAALRGGSVDAVVIVGDPPWFDTQCGREAAGSSTRLVALVPDLASAGRLDRLGATVLAYEVPIDAVVAACTPSRRDEPAVHERARPPAEGRVVTVWGPKGAPGRSTVALELASELAAHEAGTLLVDADTSGGDLLQMMGVTDELPTIVWATQAAAKGRLDNPEAVGRLRRPRGTGPVLIPGIARSDLWPEVSHFGFTELIRFARGEFSWTVLDVSSSFEVQTVPYPDDGEGRDTTTRAALRAADHVVAVCRGDAVGIKNFLWSFVALRNFVTADVSVVVNRVRAGDESQVAEIIRRYAGIRPRTFLHAEPDRIAEAVLRGDAVRSIWPGSSFAAAVRDLAASIGGPARPRGLLARLGGRS